MSETALISVFLVEDDVAMREAFERMVDAHPDLTLVGTAGTIADAEAELAHVHAQVAIIDLGLPDGDGDALIESLRISSPDTAVLVSTVFGDEAHVVRAIEAGARGYLLKDTTPEELARSILQVVSGDAPLSPQIARHLLKRFSPPSANARSKAAGPDNGMEGLTPREFAILEQIACGFTVIETAEILHISRHTVATHVRNIYGKLAVTNRMQAINEARRKGMIR